MKIDFMLVMISRMTYNMTIHTARNAFAVNCTTMQVTWFHCKINLNKLFLAMYTSSDHDYKEEVFTMKLKAMPLHTCGFWQNFLTLGMPHRPKRETVSFVVPPISVHQRKVAWTCALKRKSLCIAYQCHKYSHVFEWPTSLKCHVQLNLTENVCFHTYHWWPQSWIKIKWTTTEPRGGKSPQTTRQRKKQSVTQQMMHYTAPWGMMQLSAMLSDYYILSWLVPWVPKSERTSQMMSVMIADQNFSSAQWWACPNFSFLDSLLGGFHEELGINSLNMPPLCVACRENTPWYCTTAITNTVSLLTPGGTLVIFMHSLGCTVVYMLPQGIIVPQGICLLHQINLVKNNTEYNLLTTDFACNFFLFIVTTITLQLFLAKIYYYKQGAPVVSTTSRLHLYGVLWEDCTCTKYYEQTAPVQSISTDMLALYDHC